MLKKLSALVLIVGMLSVIGCASHLHKVGDGAQGTEVATARQWYILWGLVPINDVDTNAMAGDATDYNIVTEITVLDFILNIFTGSITVNSRSVTVEK